MEDDVTKITQLRNNEYYCMQEVLDELYRRSLRGDNFDKLTEKITDDNNIRLAYRNIKNNHGSGTNGISGKNLVYIAKMKLGYFIKRIKRRIKCYEPQMIRQVGIPKSNGKIRYLGIKEPEDKIIEQAIYQIMEPILTAKFHNNSNGFIKGRSCHRAIAQMTNYIVKDKLYFVVDIDIKGFFDNVNHGKLLKQLWSLGIRDKNLLSIISKMLKAEVYKVGIPEKGTPQGGILSPLLANVVLNELDWWLESKKNKGIRFVRYADDFKILCPTFSIAREMLDKTTRWLDNRLGLEVSLEKTRIVNLKRNYSEFLGFKIKIKMHKNKPKIISHMSDKAIKNTKDKVKKQLRVIKNKSVKHSTKEIDRYNLLIMGTHNYYKVANMIYEDLNFINFIAQQYLYRNFQGVLTFDDKADKHNFIISTYGKGRKLPFIRGRPIIPIGLINHTPARYRSDKINYFKEESRNLFHKKLGLVNLFVLYQILRNPYFDETVEFNDNVISKFCGQYGKYAITSNMIINNLNCEVIKKNITNNSDKYDNILLVENKVANLLKLERVDDIIEVSNLKRGLTCEQLKKINEIRKENNLSLI